MARYFLLCLACAAGYWLPVLINLPTSGISFHLELASWSFAIVGIALTINCGRLSLAVAGVECAAILLNLICAIQAMTVKGFIYEQYGIIVSALTVLEALVLLGGAPWSGICRAIRELRSPAAHRYSVAHRIAVDRSRG